MHFVQKSATSTSFESECFLLELNFKHKCFDNCIKKLDECSYFLSLNLCAPKTLKSKNVWQNLSLKISITNFGAFN